MPGTLFFLQWEPMGVALAFAALVGRGLIQWPWKTEDTDIIADVYSSKSGLQIYGGIIISKFQVNSRSNSFL